MILPNGRDTDEYIVEEIGEAEPVVWTLKDPGPAKTEYDINTSLFAEYRFYNNEEMSLSVTNLVGCTMMVIVSRRGVYIGHYWENISFDTDADHSLFEKVRRKPR